MFFSTATDDLLGSGKFTISPIFVPMYAGGPNWFIAPMIFPYRTDFAGLRDRAGPNGPGTRTVPEGGKLR